MKKCPKCGKTYDDTWKMCLHCSVALSDNLSIVETNPEIWKKQEGKPLPLFAKISILIIGLIMVLTPIALFVLIEWSSASKMSVRVDREFIQDFDRHSKVEILQFIRDREEDVMSHPRNVNYRKLLEEAKKEWETRKLKKP